VNYFSDVSTRLPRAPRARRIGLGLAALGASALIAGCGSSGNSSTITIGAENKTDEALANNGASGATGATGASGAPAKTPTSGPLSKEPHITPPSGPPPTKLVTKEIVKGTGTEAKTGSAVAVNYVGALYKTGKVFDASWKRNEPFTFTLGKGQVIPGWEQGVVGMKVGGRRELIIPSALGYGAKGSPPTIPPNETLIFIVDLLSA
jgi:peptidylprolyl isomerase